MQVNKPITALLALIVAGMAFFIFAWPKYQESVGLDATLSQKQAQYDGQSVYYANITSIIKDIESRKQALGKVDDSLPSTLTLAPIMYFFNQQGAESGLIVKSVTFTSPPEAAASGAIVNPKGSQVKDVMFGLDLVGSYEGFKSFLAGLESSSRLFEVDNIVFQPIPLSGLNQKKNQIQTYEFKLEVVTHTY